MEASMSSVPAHREKISIEDYLAGETRTEIKHEYLDGEVVAMGGASAKHGLVVTGLGLAIGPHARRKGCQLFMADMKVRVLHTNQTFFYYPDLLLACDPQDRDPYYRRHPCLIVEVLSPSTERIDHREKLFAYQAIPTLREYLLVDPEKRQVEIYRFGDPAQYEVHTQGSVRLDCLDVEITLDDIYMDAEAL
jgi:Uma2 family endonuclease